KLGERQLGFVHDRVVRIKCRILRQVSELCGFGERHFAALGHDFTGDDLEERGLSRTIVADQSHALAGIDQKTQSVKYHSIAERFLEVLDGQKRQSTNS